MTGHALSGAAVSTGMERYLASEARLWDACGVGPMERFVEIDRRARLRVLDVGSGRPTLFLHGTIGPGAWAPLVGRLPGPRSLILDRPGWGLSDPVDYPTPGMRPFVADLLVRVLDGLGLDRVDLVGGSIGNLWALALAEHHPDRVGRVTLLGGGPLVDAVHAPPMIRALASPIGAIIVRRRISPAQLESLLRESGHGPSLDARHIPDILLDWRRSAHNDTAAMRHERAMVRRVVRGRDWQPGITFDDDALQRIEPPVLLVYGTLDRMGDVDVWRRFVAAMPDGSLQQIEGAGHMPWFDDLGRAASLIGEFLGRTGTEARPLESAYAGRSRSAGPM